MKKFLSSSLLITVLLFFNSFTSKENNLNQAFSSVIKQQIEFPTGNSQLHHEEILFLSVSVDSNGTIEVTNFNTSNESLANEIISQMEHMIAGEKYYNQEYALKLSFKKY